MKKYSYLRELAAQLSIDERKIRDYALNLKHPHGGNKAKIFQTVLGLEQNDYHQLIQLIEEKSLDLEAIPHSTDEWGSRYSTIFEMIGVTGRTAKLEIGWIIEPNNRIARLITIRVSKKEK